MSLVWETALVPAGGWLEHLGSEIEDRPKPNGTHKADDVVRHAEVRCGAIHQQCLCVQPQDQFPGKQRRDDSMSHSCEHLIAEIQKYCICCGFVSTARFHRQPDSAVSSVWVQLLY